MNKMTLILAVSLCLAGAGGCANLAKTSVPDIRAQTAAAAMRAVLPIENTFKRLPSGPEHPTTAPLMGNGDMGVCILGQPDALRFMLAKNDFWHFKLEGHNLTRAVPFGNLSLDVPALKGADFKMTQHLADAKTVGYFNLADGSGVAMTTFVAATANVLVVQLAAQGKPFEATAGLAAGNNEFQDVITTDSTNGLWSVTRAFTQNVDIPTRLSATLKVAGAAGPKFILNPGHPVTLLLSMVSNFDAPDTLAKSRQLAASADAAQLLEAHQAWWARYWGQSFVEIADQEIMRRYYTAQYVLGSASRNPKFPPGIIGPWFTDNNPWFYGGYWMNYNFAAGYYALYSSNHLEQADPQDAPLLDFMPHGTQYAKDILHTRGMLYPVGLGPLGYDLYYKTTDFGGPPNVEGGVAITWGQRSDAAYNLVNMGQRWYTTYDLAYGKKIYPYVMGVVNFWEDYLTLEDGRYVINNDSVHEGSGGDKNPAPSLALVRNALLLALDMSKEMHVDAGRRAKWQEILEKLSAFPTKVINGKKIFILAEKGMVMAGSNTVHIQLIYPAGQIGLDSDPELLQIARNTLEAYPRWYDTNGANSFFPMAARIGYDPQVILNKLQGYAMMPNGYVTNNPHGIETCSTVPNTVDEMLMQSHEGVLRFFPAWPKMRDANFGSLRARGAFLVWAQLKDGVVGGVKVVSEKGKDCAIVNPWPGKMVRVMRHGKPAESASGERFTLKTLAGETFEIKCIEVK